MTARRLLILVSALMLVATSCSAGTATSDFDTLVDIDGVTQLAEVFNTNEGSPRLILLLSPT